MHSDSLGNGFEVQRPQMLNAVGQKTVLLTHYFRGHLQDRFGPLIEALANCARNAGRDVASVDDARAMLNLAELVNKRTND